MNPLNNLIKWFTYPLAIPFWNIVAPIVGSLISSRGAKKAADRSASTQEAAAQLQYQQSLPWSTTGMFGGATFDEEGRTAELTLSPELQAQADRLFGRAGVTAEQVEGMMGDPFAMQQELYRQQKELFAPQQERERLNLEARLAEQGTLFATGGIEKMRALQEAQQQQDLARQVQSLGQVQDLIDRYRGREAEDISQALTLGELPLSYAELGRGIGSNLSRSAQYGAGLRSGAAKNISDTQSAFWGQLGKSIGGMEWGGSGGLFGGTSMSPTTGYGGYGMGSSFDTAGWLSDMNDVTF